MLLIMVLLATSCAGGDGSPYGGYDDEGYNVSVKFDANGGEFTTGTSTLVDTYNISSLNADENGNVKIYLVSPDNKEIRGATKSYSAYKDNCFLVGWYTTRTLVKEGTDTEPAVYEYSGRWDFNTMTHSLKKDGEYTAAEPELTLYAAWLPVFEVQYYPLGSDGTGEPMYSYKVANPLHSDLIKLPEWNLNSGKMDYPDSFAKQQGYTFEGAFLDSAGTEPIDDSSFTHRGAVNLDNATSTDPIMKVYVQMKAGDWYKISTATQFKNNANLKGYYEILDDLDFDGIFWPDVFTTGVFEGKIFASADKSIKNISVTQSSVSNTFGLFGTLGADAKIQNISFENISVEIEKGCRPTAPYGYYGVLAGQIISETGCLDNVKVSGKLSLSPNMSLCTNSGIGLVAGYGNIGAVDYSNIVCEALEIRSPKYELTITTDGNKVNTVFTKIER